jgi:hypothetical protein
MGTGDGARSPPAPHSVHRPAARIHLPALAQLSPRARRIRAHRAGRRMSRARPHARVPIDMPKRRCSKLGTFPRIAWR